MPFGGTQSISGTSPFNLIFVFALTLWAMSILEVARQKASGLLEKRRLRQDKDATGSIFIQTLFATGLTT